MKFADLLRIALLTPFIGLITVAGCTKQAPATDNTTDDSLSKSYLALGDSYTIGESVSTQERFPAQTVAILKSHGARVAQPQYIARTGWTTTDLQDAINKTSLKTSYDLVSLLIGVNDQYQGLDTGGYRIRFTQLLQKAIQLAGNDKSRVFVLSIPDYSVTPFGGGSGKIKNEIDMFNAINHRNFGIPSGTINSPGFLNQWATNGGNRRIIIGGRLVF